MKVITLAGGFAIVLAILVELMFSYLEFLLGIDPKWHWLVLVIAGLIGLAMIIYGLVPRRDENEEIITPSVTDKTGTKIIVIKRSTWERFIEWWKKH